MSERRWTIALLSSDDDAVERMDAACDLDPSLVLVHVQSAEQAVRGARDGRYDVVATSYPPRIEWIDPLRECAEAALCIWLAGSNDVAAAYASAFSDDERFTVFAHGVLDHEDLTPTAVSRACIAADYTKELQQRVQRLIDARAAGAERARLANFIIGNSSVVVFRWSPAAGSPVQFVSENVSIFGYTAEEMTAADFYYQSIIHPDDLEQNLRRLKEYTESGIDRFVLSYRIFTRDGEERWIEDDTTIERDAEGRVLFHQGIVFDVTQRRAAQDQLVRLSQAVEQSPGSIVIADTRGRIEYVNSAFTRISGYEWDEVTGRELIGFNAVGDEQQRALWRAIIEGVGWDGEMRKRHRDGDEYWEQVKGSPVRGARGRITHYMVVGEDITERKRSEATIRKMAYYDALTGLPNRTLFYDRLDQALAASRRTGRGVGVLFLDLDEFKSINDTLGHASGDDLLQQVACRLTAAVREADTVARMGGDEFIVIASDLDTDADAGAVARSVVDAFREPFELGASSVRVTTSVGVATYPEDGEESEALIQSADHAMYDAKQAGRNGIAFASGSHADPSFRRLTLHDMLGRALARDELRMLVQPVVRADDGEVVGVEALLRWAHPERGLLAPSEFLAMADGSDMPPEVDMWAVREACGVWAALEHAGYGHLDVTVNVADHHFMATGFQAAVGASLAEFGVPEGRIILELSAPSLTNDVDGSAAALRALRAAGVRIALGAVGAGTWTLRALQRLPLDVIRLERELVRRTPDARDDAALAAAVVAMARQRGIDVVAQGVEGGAQLDFVTGIGCRLVQGFAFALPMPREELLGYLDAPPATERSDPNTGSGRFD